MATQINSTFAIIIDEFEGQHNSFAVEAKGPDDIKVQPCPFNLSLSTQHIHILNLLAEKPTRVSVNELESLGQALYQVLFVPEIAIAFGEARQRIAHTQEGLRIRIQTSVNEIARLPWELMHDGRDFIALRSGYPMVRGTGTPIASLRTDVSGALKILYAWSDPKDLPGLRLREPALQIQELLSENKRIRFEILENATRDSLSSSLLNDYHILCFAGHGTTDHLYLEKDNGHEKVSAEALALELEGKPTRLMFLAACEAGAYTQNNLPGFAQTLASQVEVPAVVAMQYPVNDREANLFTARYIEAVARFRPVDVALAEARKVVYEEEQVVRDVFSPVLYLQSESSRLFRPSRNWIAVSLGILAIIATLAFTLQMLYFRPDREEILSAQQTAQAEAVARSEALATARAEATRRFEAEVLASNESARADTESNIARSQAVAEQSARLLAHNPQLAQLLAIESLHYTQTASAESALRSAAAALGGIGLHGHKNSVRQVSFSDDGSLLITSSAEPESTTIIWDTTQPIVTHRERFGIVSGLDNGDLASAPVHAISSNKRWLVLAGIGAPIRLWDLTGEISSSQPLLLSRYEERIQFAGFSADDRWLIVQGYGYLKLWDTEMLASSPEPLLIDLATTAQVVLGANKTILVGACSETEICLWNLIADDPTKEFIQISAIGNSISLIDMSEDARWVATADVNGTVKLWNLEELDNFKPVLLGNHPEITNLEISQEGSWIATGSADSTVLIWRLDNLEVSHRPIVIDQHTARITDLAFSPDERWLITAADDGKLIAWDIETLGEKYAYTLILKPEMFKDSSDYLALERLEEWEYSVHDHMILVGQDISSGWIEDIEFSPDGHWLAAGYASTNTIEAPSVRLWDFRDLQIYAWPAILDVEHDGPLYEAINTVFFSQDSKWLVAASSHEAILWKLTALQNSHSYLSHAAAVLEVTKYGQQGSVTEIVLSKDNRWLVVAGPSPGSTIRLWKLNEIEHNTKPVELPENSAALAISPDGRWLANAPVYSNDVSVWDLHSNLSNPTYTLRGHNGTTQAIAFSIDSRSLITGSDDHNIRVWNLAALDSSQDASVLRGHDASISRLEISSDGRWLISRSQDGELRQWDLRATDIQGSVKEVSPQDFPGDSLTAATSDGLQTVTAASAVAGLSAYLQNSTYPDAQLIPLDLPNSLFSVDATAKAISPDDRWVAIGKENGTVLLWPLPTESMVQNICLAAGRNLTDVEWATYFPQESYRQTCAAYPAFGQSTLQVSKDPVGSIHALGINPETVTSNGAILPSSLFLLSDRDGATTDATDDIEQAPQEQVGLIGKVVTKPYGGSFVEFSPNGRYLAVQSGETLRVLDTKNWKDLFMRQPLAWVGEPVFSPNSEWVAAGMEDYAATLWSLPEGHLQFAAMHDYYVADMSFTADSDKLVTVSQDNHIRVLDVQTGSLLGDVVTEVPLLAVTLDENGKWLVTLGAERWLPSVTQLWDIDSLQPFYRLEGGLLNANALEINSEGTLVASDRRVWNISTGQQVFSTEADNAFYGDILDFSNDGISLFTAFEAQVYMWDVQTWTLMRSFTSSFDTELSPLSVEFSRDGRLIAMGSEGGFEIWEVESGEQLVKQEHLGQVQSMAFSSDVYWFSVASPREVSIWSLHEP